MRFERSYRGTLFKNFTSRHWIYIFLIIGLILFGLFILPISVPLVLAFFTALFLNPAVRAIKKRFKLNRKITVTIVYLTFLLLLAFIGTYAVTTIIKQLVLLAENAPSYINHINNKLLEWNNNLEIIMQDLPNDFVNQVNSSISDAVKSIDKVITDNIQVERVAGMVATILTAIPQYIVSFLVYLIALFLFMLELPFLKAKFYQNFTDHTAEKVQFMTGRLKYVLVGFLKAQFLVSIFIFTVTLLGLLWIIPEYAIGMSLIIWLIDFVPIIGSIAILGPWSLYMFITGNILMGTQLAVLAIVLLAIRRTVEPKVMGQQIGLSPLATLIAMYLGLQLIGILGFIIGPVLVIAFTSAKEAGIIKWNVKL